MADDCRNALLAIVTDPKVDRADLIATKGERTEGTCEWLLQDDAYHSWLRGDVRCLWISGGPGKGKTMLSIFLTEELETRAQEPDTNLLFMFCVYQDRKRNNESAILSSLIC